MRVLLSLLSSHRPGGFRGRQPALGLSPCKAADEQRVRHASNIAYGPRCCQPILVSQFLNAGESTSANHSSG